jgi:hypothetical protein
LCPPSATTQLVEPTGEGVLRAIGAISVFRGRPLSSFELEPEALEA